MKTVRNIEFNIVDRINRRMKMPCEFKGFQYKSEFEDGIFDLEFLISDIIKAAITVGKGDFDTIFAARYFSKYELEFRISMLLAFLSFEEEYLRRSEAFCLLDPSEKGAINYFLGMVFSSLVSTLKLNVKWLIHLDSYDKTLIKFKDRKKPDFIGITNDDNRIVLESKSWMIKRNEGVNNALQQLRAVLEVEGERNITKIASILYGKQNLFLEVIDPKEREQLEVTSKNSDYLKDYYARIFTLLLDSNDILQIDNCVFITNSLNCGTVKVGLLHDVYEIIYQSIYRDVSRSYVTGKIREVLFKKEKELKAISMKNNFTVGLDGIIVKYRK